MNLFLRFSFRFSTLSLDLPWRSHTNCKAASGKSLAVTLDSMSSLRPRSKVQGFQRVSAHFLMPYILLLPRALRQTEGYQIFNSKWVMLIQPQGLLGDTLDTPFSKCKAKAFWGRIGESHLSCHTPAAWQEKNPMVGTALLPVGTYPGVFLEHVTNLYWRRAATNLQTNTAGCWAVTQVLILPLTSKRAWSEKRRGNLPHAWNHQHSQDKVALQTKLLAPQATPTLEQQRCQSTFVRQLGGYLGLQHPAAY